MICYCSCVYAQKLPGDPEMFSTVEKIRFLERSKDYVFDNGAIVSFTEPIGDIDVMEYPSHSLSIWSGASGYYAVIGVGIKIHNTSNNTMVIKWNQSSFRIGLVLCQDLVQHKMRNFNYFQLTNSDSLATLAL